MTKFLEQLGSDVQNSIFAAHGPATWIRVCPRKLNSVRLSPWVAVALLIGAALAPHAAAQTEVRIKDLTDVFGMRTEKLVGMGLVAGLDGTGGKNPSTRQFATNLLQNYGNRMDPVQRTLVRDDAKEKTDNLSVVIVTAELPPLAKSGTKVDVLVSTYDDASSLQGGLLVFTPLVGVDGEVYAVAQGPVSIGGFSAGGQAASVQKNHPTSGRIPNGASRRKGGLHSTARRGRPRAAAAPPSGF